MGALRPAAFLLLLAIAARVARCDLVEDALTLYLDSATDCIQTPAEYVAAFQARQPRCVSADLVGRVSSGATAADARLVDASTRLSYFFSGSDVLAKYLRIGYPQVIGFSTVGDAAGLLTGSTGLALMQQVGYQLEYVNVSRAYVLTVASSAALEAAAGALQDGLPYRGGVPPLPPTWAALRSYFEFAFEYENLTLSDAALGVLQNSSFAALTGCPPNCAYRDAAFASPGHDTPTVTASPLPDGACPPPPPGTKASLSSALDPGSQLCDAGWNEAVAAAAALYPQRSCSAAQNEAAGAGLAALLAAARPAPRREAQLFRAFLLQYCTGGYYPLFSGDGYTYSSFGGLLTPLGTELVTSPFLVGALRPGDEVASLELCISGSDTGRPNAAGGCSLPSPAPAPAAAAPAAATGRRLLRRGR